MKPALPTLLVTHPGLGEGLIQAAAAIVGDEPEVDHLSNRGLSPEALGEKIDTWVRSQSPPVLILTDLGFGSCCQSARAVTRARGEVGIVAGVNLPMLLAVLRSRPQKDLDSFLRHVADRGRGGVEVYVGGDPA